MVPGRQLVSLDLHIVPWQGTVCVQYDALQVDRYDFDQSTTRFEFSRKAAASAATERDHTMDPGFSKQAKRALRRSSTWLAQGQDFVDRVLFVPLETGRRRSMKSRA